MPGLIKTPESPKMRTVATATEGPNWALDHLEVEKIFGARKFNGHLFFLIKWKGLEQRELIPSQIANHKCPQLVIDFYEKHLTWYPSYAYPAASNFAPAI